MKANSLFLIAGVIVGILSTVMYQNINGEKAVDTIIEETSHLSVESPEAISDEVASLAGNTMKQKASAAAEKPEDDVQVKRPESEIVDPDLLVSMFPDNRALPVFTEEERLQRKQEKTERDKLFGKISANIATEAEVRQYYKSQKLLSEDSIQLLEFVLKQYSDTLSERSLKKHEFLLKQFKKRLDHIPKKEADALARLNAINNKNG